MPGQSIVELIVAMAVITIGLTGAGILVLSNIRLQELSADRVVATNLAREGIELAKAQRDSNWLAGCPIFYGGMVVGSSCAAAGGGNDYEAIPSVGAAGTFFGFDFTPDAIGETDYTKIVRSSAAASRGMYIQGIEGGVPVAGTSTPFYRFMTFHLICSDGFVKTSGSGGCSNPVHGVIVGIRVTSRVEWSKHGLSHQSTIVDDLYDWR
jgi:type II secretory pathway pseudopilin PulG